MLRPSMKDIMEAQIFDYNIISFFRRLRVEFQFCELGIISYKIKTYNKRMIMNDIFNHEKAKMK
jgi:hypothetical protein